jgi:DNA-directed RNA polymerase specialized sigma24 family protein
MSQSRQPSLPRLMELFERTRRHDTDARAELDEWFQNVRRTVIAGVEARQQLESLAYCVSEQDAARQIRPGGAFPRLRHDPGSVAYRHRQRFVPFLEALQRGEERTIEQFVSAVSGLTRFVLLDMQSEDDAEPVQSATEDLAQSDTVPADQEMSRDEQLALLADVYHRLTQEQLIILLLVRYTGMSQASVARLMGMKEHHVAYRLQQIARVVAEMQDRSE